MSEFTDDLTIRATPDQVFRFVSDIANLPAYLPTTRHAQTDGPERVRVQGEAHGHRYDSDGYLRTDQQLKRMEWGADEGGYRGWLEIEPAPDGTRVAVGIMLKPAEAGHGQGPSESDIRDGLRKALQSIQNHLEGDGGKVKPAAETA
jgi:uncharacterized protein YndB with AHSA1/START domain